MSFKRIVKQIIIRVKLYSTVIFLHQTLTYRNFLNIFRAFTFYFFNNIITFFPNHLFRKIYLKYVLKVKIGKRSFIHMGARLEGNIEIGNNSVVGRKCVLIGTILIKNNVSITAEAYIFTTSHLVNDSEFNCFYTNVVINDYAWIGARAIIQPGVIIGRGAVLGSGSVATKHIPEFEIYAGAPAKYIGTRSRNLTYNLNYSPFFQ